MGMLRLYASFLTRHPGKLLLSGIVSVSVVFILTLLVRPLPSFYDPLIGFEARDTLISRRLNIWKLLQDETSALANDLSLWPNSASYEVNYHQWTPELHVQTNNNAFQGTEPPVLIDASRLSQLSGSDPTMDKLDDEEEEFYKSLNSTGPNQTDWLALVHHSLGSSEPFCGKLSEGYAQVVVTGKHSSTSGLFNLNSLNSICQLDQKLRLETTAPHETLLFQRDCERFQLAQQSAPSTACCNSWSVPNYVACLNNKPTCKDITANDVKQTRNLLTLCAPYYFKSPHEECFVGSQEEEWPMPDSSLSMSSTADPHNILPLTNLRTTSSRTMSQWPKVNCGNIPEKCLKCDGWIYTLMNFLVNENFIQTKPIHYTAQPKQQIHINRTNNRKDDLTGKKTQHDTSVQVGKLTATNIFLPLAKSSSLMKYYQTLSKQNLNTPLAHIKAMDLGLKNSLFEHMIAEDLRLFLLALVSILIVISIYTWSLILSLVILVIICLSLCLSYVFYQLIFDIPVFPFMNLLSIVISFGICSDNAMLFCKHWSFEQGYNIAEQCSGTENNKQSNLEITNLDRLLKRAIVSTFIATSATAFSFIVSAISKVIAVRCFCVFATLSVITNYMLIVILLPPALILDSRFSSFILTYLHNSPFRPNGFLCSVAQLKNRISYFGKILHNRLIYHTVTEFKFYLIITFLTLLSCSCILVFHRPTLQPADEEDMQLLSRKHAFEQYDKNLKKQFTFERNKMAELSSNTIRQTYEIPDTLPVRIVFGVKPIDNGNHLDPHDKGTLEFDLNFDITEPNAQIWLLEFCRKLKQQSFIFPSTGPELSNCFIDTFKTWMEARPCEDPIDPHIDRSPCCQAYDFPYTKTVFNKCIGPALNIIRKTPQLNPNLNAGIRFFRNSTRVAAVILEYQSNRFFSHSFTRMERFFNVIDEWVTWQVNNTAPPSLKSGWFISSNLELLALQLELEQSTVTSILIEIMFAMIALLIGTRDLLLTTAGTIAIGTIIIVSVAILILLKWILGVVESILISLTIGLSIDFALHYCIAYSESKKIGSIKGIIQRILDDVGSPIALATVTTSVAGFVIVWSDIMAYQELGVFLMLIALTSWLTSTFFLLPMLELTGIVVERGDIQIKTQLRRLFILFLNRL